MTDYVKVYDNRNVEGYSNNKTKWKISLIFIVIALVSFFIIAHWATSVQTYSGVMEILNSLQQKALGLTGTSAILATGAAAIPGEAATPIANKLADVAGYMVIVYCAIMIEKYLLTLTGFIAFKILLPIGFLMAAVGNFMKTGWKICVYQLSVKCVVLGLLLWCLVPTSAWITNWINDTYHESYQIDETLVEESKDIEEEEQKDEEEIKPENENKFSISNVYQNFKDKVDDVVENVEKIATEKLEKYQNAFNQMIEAIAVMIVTTCVIPILVMLGFLGILRMVTGWNLNK